MTALASLLDRAEARPRLVPGAIVAVSLGALAIALASEHWGGLEPCVLCYYQRYAYLGALAFGLAGLALAARPAVRRACIALAGLAFLTGAGIAAFHVGVEQHWWRGTAGCHAPAFDPDLSIEALREQMLQTRFVPCDAIPWSLFGISIAGYNFLVSLALAALTLGWAWRGAGAKRTTGAEQA